MRIDNDHFNILYVALVSFFAAFCKEINDKARTKEDFSMFIGEVALHGFSGWLLGVIACKWLTDVESITFVAGVGGLLGYNLIQIIAKIAISVLAQTKNIDINVNDIDFNNDLEKSNKDKKNGKKK